MHKALRPRIYDLLSDLWSKEDAARDFSDPEGVHQMRVASRKLRAALDADDVFHRTPERRLRRRIRQLTRALGAVRDADVMIADLQSIKEDGAHHPGVDRLITRLERDRDAARTDLLGLLDELEAARVPESSLATFASPRNDAGARIRRRDACALIEHPRETFLALTGELPAEDDIETLHRLRIATKRLRYAIQVVDSALTPESDAILDGLRDMQDQLGEIHNHDVLIELIRDELHVLVDEDIAGAMTDAAMRATANEAGRNDLLALLSRTARDRHDRYIAFVRWWSEARTAGFTVRLGSLGSRR